MAIKDELLALDEVVKVRVEKHHPVYGQDATLVVATLADGRTVAGTFANEDRAGFGGIEFNTRYNIVKLMRSKIRAVLRGTADEDR